MGKKNYDPFNNRYDYEVNVKCNLEFHEGQPFTGIVKTPNREFVVVNGYKHGWFREYTQIKTIYCSFSFNLLNGYYLEISETGISKFKIYDLGIILESIEFDEDSTSFYFQKIPFGELYESWIDKKFKEETYKQCLNLIENNLDYNHIPDALALALKKDYNLSESEAYKKSLIYFRLKNEKLNFLQKDIDLLPYYAIQDQMKELVDRTTTLNFSDELLIAGADVAYDEKNQQVIGGIVVLDGKMKVIESSTYQMEISFPYIPGLFSFREAPAILKAFDSLKNKPDVLIVNGHGIAHPKNFGLACHIGVELNIPTIGCAKTKLVGSFDREKLGSNRGDYEQLFLDDEEIGVGLRTQDNIKPIYVSIGHKIDLKTSISLVLKMCTKYRFPETTRAADSLVNSAIKRQS